MRVGCRELTRNISLECDYDVDVDGDDDVDDNYHNRASGCEWVAERLLWLLGEELVLLLQR